MTRGRILLIATGMQGIGKSFLSLNQALYQAYKAKHKNKCLIFETNIGEYKECEIDGTIHKIPQIGHNDIIRYGNHPKPDVRRISPCSKKGVPMSDIDTENLLIKVLNEFRGGSIIAEDLNKIFGDNLPDAITGALCNVRHRNCDLTLHLQSVGRIGVKMLQNVKVVRYHYQLEPIENSRDKLKGETEIFMIAEKLVNEQFTNGNRYFCVYIYREIKKIRGKFSPRMFSVAIQEYISENSRVLRALLAKVDNRGKRINTYETALLAKTKELFLRYYG